MTEFVSDTGCNLDGVMDFVDRILQHLESCGVEKISSIRLSMTVRDQSGFELEILRPDGRPAASIHESDLLNCTTRVCQ